MQTFKSTYSTVVEVTGVEGDFRPFCLRLGSQLVYLKREVICSNIVKQVLTCHVKRKSMQTFKSTYSTVVEVTGVEGDFRPFCLRLGSQLVYLKREVICSNIVKQVLTCHVKRKSMQTFKSTYSIIWSR